MTAASVGFGRLSRKEDERFIRGARTVSRRRRRARDAARGDAARPDRPRRSARDRRLGRTGETEGPRRPHPRARIAPADVDVVHGDTDNTPYGLGTYGSRSTPVRGAATALVARQVRDKARLVASAMLEVSAADLEWERGRWFVRGDPEQGASIAAIPSRRLDRGDRPSGPGLGGAARGDGGRFDCETVYDPPNLTFPFGAHVCVVDVDPGTGKVSVRRFVAVDDCGTQINPMIVEGQVHGGLTDGVGIALMEMVGYDEEGNRLSASLMGYPMPTAVKVPEWESSYTVTPSPHHPLGAKGIGESATVGSPPAIVDAVCEAVAPYGVRHMDMRCTPARVWEAMQGKAVAPR